MFGSSFICVNIEVSKSLFFSRKKYMHEYFLNTLRGWHCPSCYGPFLLVCFLYKGDFNAHGHTHTHTSVSGPTSVTCPRARRHPSAVDQEKDVPKGYERTLARGTRLAPRGGVSPALPPSHHTPWPRHATPRPPTSAPHTITRTHTPLPSPRCVSSSRAHAALPSAYNKNRTSPDRSDDRTFRGSNPSGSPAPPCAAPNQAGTSC